MPFKFPSPTRKPFISRKEKERIFRPKKLARVARLTPSVVYSKTPSLLGKRVTVETQMMFQNKIQFESIFNIQSMSNPFVPYIANNGDLIVQRSISICRPESNVELDVAYLRDGGFDPSRTYSSEVLEMTIYDQYIPKFKHGKKRKDPDIPLPPPAVNLSIRSIFKKYFFLADLDDVLATSLYQVFNGTITGNYARQIVGEFVESHVLTTPSEAEIIKKFLPDYFQVFEKNMHKQIETIMETFS